ncbi:MAG: hypothetical protein IID17_10400 [Nitrospinae bacterium]|nr:hypothetical protein [Nitrospinota bacterium]
MENKNTDPKNPAKKKPADTSKEKITRLTNSVDALSSELETLKLNIQKEKSENTTLTNSVDTLSSELETIKLNIQKRKSENTTLKILFYTGLIVLLLGFLYTNATLQRAQMDSMESSIQLLRTLMNKELLSVEKNVYQKIDLLEKDAGEQSKVNLQEALENMTLAISRLNPDDEKTATLIKQVRKNSRELREAYSEQRD